MTSFLDYFSIVYTLFMMCHGVIKQIAFQDLYSLMIFNSCLKFGFSLIFNIVSPSLKLLIFELSIITKINGREYIFSSQNLLKAWQWIIWFSILIFNCYWLFSPLLGLTRLPIWVFLFPEYSLYIAMIFITSHHKLKDFHPIR